MPLIPIDEPARAVAGLLGGRQDIRPARPAAHAGPSAEQVARVLRCRRAVRSFGEEAISADLLLQVIDDAPRLWTPYNEHELVLLVGASHVRGMAEGLYRVGQGACALLASDCGLGAVREFYGDGAASVFVCGDVGAACAPRGVGYGGLLVRAGALGHACWLSAISSGLVGCAYGGTCGEITKAADRWRPGLRHLFTVTLGFAPAPETQAAGNSEDPLS
ncbi:hypothetical protein [Microbispora sp. ATCC PTA-5024]|uniref:hypothetical protein n=1 Tax=Microbispora sp. ATCC PTA-5024 TaxID=316330 RepID=UPI0003DC007D|nr:hypothetical protein [Microbispora sp. ATCC PTA-5024]ETK37760.1 hypothetical protein MPTA5024_02170 [Microbispora sp. ATCC PTA-5024]